MELTTLKASLRSQTAGRTNGRLRKQGHVPAIYYGKGQEPVAITIDAVELRKVLAPGKRYTLLNLEIDGKGGHPAIVHDYQKDNLSQEITHIDFLRITTEDKVRVRVQVKLEGLPVGVKTEGGTLSQESRYLNMWTFPNRIPASIVLDINEVRAGTTCYAKDLQLPEGAELASVPRLVIYSISKARVKEDKDEKKDEKKK